MKSCSKSVGMETKKQIYGGRTNRSSSLVRAIKEGKKS